MSLDETEFQRISLRQPGDGKQEIVIVPVESDPAVSPGKDEIVNSLALGFRDIHRKIDTGDTDWINMVEWYLDPHFFIEETPLEHSIKVSPGMDYID